MYVHLPDPQIVADVEIRKVRQKSKSRCQTGEYNNKVTMLLPFLWTFNKSCVSTTENEK